MSNSGNVQDKWKQLREKMGPGLEKTGEICSKVGYGCGQVGAWIFKLRKVFLALPVVIGAIYLAIQNNQKLPEEVGINLLADGTFSNMVPRNIVVLGPIAVTALCLLLMMCSRKTLYPWFISVFSLVLPILIYVTNSFPT